MGIQMNRLYWIIIVLAILITSCAQAGSPISDATEGPPSASHTIIIESSYTPKPTDTPLPTNTPRPTNTPQPTATDTPVPEPIVISGSGDDVVDIDKWSGPAILRITYHGGSNFVVWNYGTDGEKIDLLVNTIGSYEGTRPLDFMDDEFTTRFQIESSGQWEITILPFIEIRTEQVPSTFIGRGDDVIYLNGEPDLLRIDASTAKSNFVIWGFGNRIDLLVNEIAPYDGVVIAGSDIFVLVIEAEGDWSIEVTSK
jgi:hypothetical protein